MNRRFPLIAAACLFTALTPSLLHAQAKPAAQTAAPVRNGAPTSCMWRSAWT